MRKQPESDQTKVNIHDPTGYQCRCSFGPLGFEPTNIVSSIRVPLTSSQTFKQRRFGRARFLLNESSGSDGGKPRHSLPFSLEVVHLIADANLTDYPVSMLTLSILDYDVRESLNDIDGDFGMNI